MKISPKIQYNIFRNTSVLFTNPPQIYQNEFSKSTSYLNIMTTDRRGTIQSQKNGQGCRKFDYASKFIDRKNIVMEKQGIINKRYRGCEQSLVQEASDSTVEKSNFKPLGGINLYNEHYQRHLENPNGSSPKSPLQRKSFVPHQGPQKKLSSSFQDFNTEYYEECEISTFMNRQRTDKFKLGHSMAEEIEDIISNLKSAQFSTVTLIHQIEKQKSHDEFQSIENIDDIIEFYNRTNHQSFTHLLARIFKELKHKMSLQIKEIKEQANAKLKVRRQDIHEQQTQTYSRNTERDILGLKSQLKKKEMEYNVLYDYKRHKLQKRDTFIECMQLQQKQQSIGRLIDENMAKTQEIKKLKKQLDSFQDKFFVKLMENQRKQSLLMKFDLESIAEDQFFKDDHKQMKKKAKNNVTHRKNGGGSYLLPRLSLGDNEVTNNIMGMIASAFNIDTQPMSMKQLPNQFNQFADFDSQVSLDVRRSSKKLFQKKSLKKLLEKYQTKDKIKKSSLRKQNEVKVAKNQSLKVITSQKHMKLRRSNVSMQKQPPKMKFQQKVQDSGLASEQPTKIEQIGSVSFKSKTKPKISINRADNKSNSSKQYILLQAEEDLASKLSSLKVVNGDAPPPNKKKLKKGVSFHLEELIAKAFLTVSSNQINFCFNPTAQNSLISQQQPSAQVENKQVTAYNSKQIVRQQSERMIESSQKQKIQRGNGKLIKTKAKSKKHFKVISCLQDLTKCNPSLNSLSHSPLATRIPNQGSRLSFNQSNLSKISIDKNRPIERIERSTYSFKKQQNQSNAESIVNQKIKELALRISNKEMFMREIRLFHQSCGDHCEHIKKYMEMFDKVRARSLRPTIKINYENINRHIATSSQIRVRSQYSKEEKRV